MKLISVNVGLPREITVSGKTVRTSIWKYPVQGLVHVSTLNLDGDQQSDLSVHGGIDKAVYLYPSEHYSYWQIQLPDVELPWGAFGENFTSEGILENQIKIGDRIRIGSADFMVTQPRMPCFKLGIRFNRRDMVKHFLASKRSGFYLSVIREGEVKNGDAIEFIEKQETGVTITDIVNFIRSIPRTKSCSAAPLRYRHYRKAGKIFFENAFGMPMRNCVGDKSKIRVVTHP